MTISLFDKQLELLPQKAMFIPSANTLLLADLHFGKVNHFRKAGVPVPAKANDKNAADLIDLLQTIKPARVIFLGDLFHSYYNNEWEVVGQILRHFPACTFELVQGNHDIMSPLQYQRYGIEIHRQVLMCEGFALSHEPLDHPDGYNLAGHVHPGARLRGNGRQSLVLPCFYFGEHGALLPAFGAFTGLQPVRFKKDDTAFVVVEGKVIQVQKTPEGHRGRSHQKFISKQ